MKPFPRLLAIAFALAPASVVAQEKVVLQYKATAGQVVKYRSTANLEVEAMGQKMNLESDETEKITFIEVASNGNITMERETISSETKINGQKLPDTGEQSKSTSVMRPDGTLVSYKREKKGGEEDDDKNLGVRLFQATNVFLTDKPVGAGDKWSKDYQANSDVGTPKGRGDYELQAFEKIAGVDTAKVKFNYKESEGSPALEVTATVWLEKSTGDTVRAEFEAHNVPFGPAMAGGKLNQERIEGSPVKGEAKPGDGKPSDTKPAPKKDKNIDETVKEYEKLPGVVTLYRKKEAGRETIYMEIREDQLGQLMMLQCTAATGDATRVIPGDPINDLVFRFEKVGDDKLMIVVPNIGFRALAGSPVARGIKRGFPDAYIEQFKIEAKQEDRKSLLITVSDLFRGDIAQISQYMSGGGGGLLGMGGGGGYGMDREKTYVASIKNFPENLVVETQYNFTRGGARGGIMSLFDGASTVADPRSVPIRVIYNLFELKDDGYRPRIADPRVGFFYTEVQDFTDDSKDDQTVRYILRWDVRKKDPKAAMSPPVKPIAFWLDNAIPMEYRDAVKEGLLWWNSAFEKAGIKDAIEVKQMPDNADFDHADMRYNVIRWSPTQSPPYGAIALFRVNPITGQIVNAGITLDAILGRVGKLEHKRLVDPATAFDRYLNPPSPNMHPHRCDFASQAMEQGWFGLTALDLTAAAPGKIDRLKYTKDFIRSIVAHEMGHIMGLWHNFKASTQHSLAELKNPKTAASGITASVMDYFPFNLSALKSKGVPYFPMTIGAYDHWVIQYGYTAIEADKPEGELFKLKQLASRGSLPGHEFQNDFYADSFDPDITRFDLSRDPLDYWAKTAATTRYLLNAAGQRLPKKGESYYDFTRSFMGLLNQYATAAANMGRYIGGIHLSRNYKGDANEKPVSQPVSPAKQKLALRCLNDYVFSERAFKFPSSYYAKLTTNPFPDMSSIVLGGGSPDFPIRDTLSNIQRSALRMVFSSGTMSRLANTEYKSSGNGRALSLTEVFRSVGSTIWSELEGKRNIDALRRQLQRNHLTTLTGLVTGSGGMEDAKMLAWDQLRSLKRRILAAKAAKTEDTTRIHLEESLARINRALDAKQMIGAASGPAPSLLDLLRGLEQNPKALEALKAALP